MKAHPKLARRARLQWDEREKKYMLLYPERGLLLNATAAGVVKLCDGSRSVEEIVSELVSTSKEGRETIERDVLAFLGRLEDRKLLE